MISTLSLTGCKGKEPAQEVVIYTSLDKVFSQPILEDAPYLIDLPAGLTPDLSDGPVIELRCIEAVPEYEVLVSRK